MGYLGNEISIREVANYWNRRPCNVRHSLRDIDRDPFGYSVDVTRRKWRVEPHIPVFANYKEWAGKYVVDFGCGIGTDAIAFAKAGAYVTAVDISDESLDIAQTRAEAEDVAHLIDFRKHDIETPVDPAVSYDLVWSFGVIHHTPNPQRALAAAWTTLKPGGTFKLMVYNRLSWKVFWILMTYGKGKFWQWEKLIPAHSEAQTGCPITWTYTPAGIRSMLEENGFLVKSVKKDHIFPYHIPSYVKHEYKKEWYWGMMPNALFRWLERRFGWHLIVSAEKSLVPIRGSWAIDPRPLT